MTLIQRVWRSIPGPLIFCSMAWLCSAASPVAQAGFELKFDSSSVRSVDDHYAIDVLLINNGSTAKLRGIFAAIASTEPGLTFLGIETPENAVFGGSFDYDSDEAPTYGEEGVPWGAYISLKQGELPITPSSGRAFQLNFSVAGSNEYGLEFVESDEMGYLTGYTEDVVGERPIVRGFDQLHSVSFNVVSTPEPSSIALFVTAVGGLGVWRHRRRSSNTSAIGQ